MQNSRNGPFQVFKNQTRKDVDTWAIHLNKQNLKFWRLRIFRIQSAYHKSIQDEVSQRGLKNIGLLPFNLDVVLKHIPQAKSFAEYEKQFRSALIAKAAGSSLVDSSLDSKAELTPTMSLENFPNEKERVSWYDIASQPSDNRSPIRKGPRGHQHPAANFVDLRVDIFDFDTQMHQKKIQGLVIQQSIIDSALKKPIGRRLGIENDIFTAADVTTKRKATDQKRLEEKAKKETTMKNRKEELVKLKNKITKLKERLATAKNKLKKEKDARKKAEKELKEVKAANCSKASTPEKAAIGIKRKAVEEPPDRQLRKRQAIDYSEQ